MERYGEEVRQARTDPMPEGRRMPEASLWGTAAWTKCPLSLYIALEGREATFSQWLHWTAVAFRRWTSGGVDEDNEFASGVARLLLVSTTGGGE